MSRLTGRSLSDSAPVFFHLNQSIHDILTTPIGTRVCRRDYGSLIPDLIDQPLTEATNVRLFSAVATALVKHEKRIKLSRVKVLEVGEGYLNLEIIGTTEINGQSVGFKDQYKIGAA